MTKTLAFLTAFILVVTACNQGKDKFTALTLDRQNIPDTIKLNLKSLTGFWALVCYSDLVKKTNDCNSDEIIRFKFKDDEKTGTIGATTRSNGFGGSYQIFANNEIKVDDFHGTQLKEKSEFESKIWYSMTQSSSFKYKYDSLIIFYDSNKKAMKFIKTKIF